MTNNNTYSAGYWISSTSSSTISYPSISMKWRNLPTITYYVTSPLEPLEPLKPLKFDFDWKPKPPKKILRKPLRMIKIREDA